MVWSHSVDFVSISARFSQFSLVSWSIPLDISDSLRETSILSLLGLILSQFSLVSWWIGLLVGWSAVQMDGDTGTVRGEGCSGQRESRMKS